MEERLTLNIAEVAKLLGISKATAYSLANSGGIPAIRISERCLIVPKKALERLLDSVGRANADS
jgi:excisionase family DNA binding protein